MMRLTPEDSGRTSVDISDCPVAVGELLADKFRVERLIGIGGMGVVVLAWHIELDQRVALKFLRKSFAGHAEAVERFRREARAAARISSDHVVRVFDVDTLETGVPYVVMEYLEGENLKQILDEVGPLEENEVAQIVIQVCEALAAAHTNHIIHRDLKPQNIYLMHRGARPPLVKVLDFGVSKSLTLDTMPHLMLTQATTLVCSPAYMSPEQLDSKRLIDARADIWGVGVLIFELLTKHVPFTGASLPAAIRAVLAGQRTPLSAYRSGVSEAMEAVLARCLTPLPEARFATVQKLAQALRPLAASDNEWAARLKPHLVPSAAAAAAYGKAHILGESVVEKSSIIARTGTEPTVSQTLHSDRGFPVDLSPSPPTQASPPLHLPRSKRTNLLALAAAIGGALVAALVVLVANLQASDDTTPRLSAAATLGAPAITVRASRPQPLPATASARTQVPAPAAVSTPEPAVASAPPAAPKRIPATFLPGDPAHTDDTAQPARPAPVNARPNPARPAQVAVVASSDSPGAAADFTDFGGRL